MATRSEYPAGTAFAAPSLWMPPFGAAQEYLLDACQRSILFLDVLRQRGNNYREHTARKAPHVLTFQAELILDGRTFERPVNYALVRITPPQGVKVDPAKRPFIVFDPRAGHGPGIGGMKHDSEIGVALRAGHPCYFVGFLPEPVPGQTVADVCHAEARFVEEVTALHPQAEGKPCLIGNCQAGWQIMIMAAIRPDLPGPIVLAGSPLSYWAGVRGKNPMRYLGGLLGGTWLTSLAGDVGNGTFDGAHLGANFESLHPSNTYWKKAYNLYSRIDTEPARYLEFEKWWGSPVLLTAQEMQAIADQLFVGNKLTSGELRTEDGIRVDLRNIKSPIVVFCSWGDDITPPQQALGWITDLYETEQEIMAAGQTIVYCLHQSIGHLGVFVSGKVATKEHAQIVEVLKYIQELPPGLYGMQIHEVQEDDGTVTYDVTLHERKLEDLKPLQKYGRVDEKPFEAVNALSELTERAYSLLVRPWVREATPEWLASTLRDWHPLRVERWMISDKNPWLWPLPYLASAARASRRVRRDDSVPVAMEHFASECIGASLDLYRDLRDAASEAAFFQVYGNMWSLSMADERAEIRRQARFDPRALPAVRQVLDTLEQGGRREGLARMAMLISRAGHGKLSLSYMQRVRDIVLKEMDIEAMSDDERRRLLQEETIVVEFEPQRAKRSLPALLRTASDRRVARRMLDNIEAHFKLDERQLELVGELRGLLPATHAVTRVRRRKAA